MQPNYKMYPTLIDSFQRYLSSEDDEAFQQFIDKVNRVPFHSEAAEKGTKFNELIDYIIAESREEYSEFMVKYAALGDKDDVVFENYKFKKKVVDQIYQQLKYSITQVFTQAYLETRYGTVLLYGYIDNLLFGSPKDIKCTSKYEFPKFLHNWQHIIYPYCLIHGDGVMPDAASMFAYEVCDYSNTYREEYIYDEERDLPKLKAMVERLIEFLEQHKDKITDLKVFAKEPPPAKTYLLLKDVNGGKGEQYGLRSQKVKMIADHGDVMIVEGPNGNKFSVSVKDLQEQ
jgi:hypothetical protein